MSLLGRWRIVEMPDYDDDYPDMMEPAYILFEPTSGEFAFGCVTGQIFGSVEADATAYNFSWSGNDEMEEAQGDGSVLLEPDGTLAGEICFHGGDEIKFIARRWGSSSTAC
jgi:hypothetical protein